MSSPATKKRKIDISQGIDELIADDVMQIILSFAPYSIRGTNKHLTKIDEKRERIAMVKIYEEFKDDDRNKDTVIIHPKRKKLHPIEKEYGFRAIVSSIQSVSNIASRILIHSGEYLSEDPDDTHMTMSVFVRDDGIELIGIGDVIMKQQVLLKSWCDFDGPVRMRNISFNGFYCSGGSIIFKDCTFTTTDSIYCLWCRVKKQIIVQNCDFISNGMKEGSHGICLRWNMSQNPKLVVTGCDFSGCECCIKMDVWDSHFDEFASSLHVEFANNKFSKKGVVLKSRYRDKALTII